MAAPLLSGASLLHGHLLPAAGLPWKCREEGEVLVFPFWVDQISAEEEHLFGGI